MFRGEVIRYDTRKVGTKIIMPAGEEIGSAVSEEEEARRDEPLKTRKKVAADLIRMRIDANAQTNLSKLDEEASRE